MCRALVTGLGGGEREINIMFFFLPVNSHVLCPLLSLLLIVEPPTHGRVRLEGREFGIPEQAYVCGGGGLGEGHREFFGLIALVVVLVPAPIWTTFPDHLLPPPTLRLLFVRVLERASK